MQIYKLAPVALSAEAVLWTLYPALRSSYAGGLYPFLLQSLKDPRI
jgi:hypothetical protein